MELYLDQLKILPQVKQRAGTINFYISLRATEMRCLFFLILRLKMLGPLLFEFKKQEVNFKVYVTGAHFAHGLGRMNGIPRNITHFWDLSEHVLMAKVNQWDIALSKWRLIFGPGAELEIGKVYREHGGYLPLSTPLRSVLALPDTDDYQMLGDILA